MLQELAGCSNPQLPSPQSSEPVAKAAICIADLWVTSASQILEETGGSFQEYGKMDRPFFIMQGDLYNSQKWEHNSGACMDGKRGKPALQHYSLVRSFPHSPCECSSRSFFEDLSEWLQGFASPTGSSGVKNNISIKDNANAVSMSEHEAENMGPSQ